MPNKRVGNNLFNKNYCIICQKRGTRVTSTNNGCKKIQDVAERNKDIVWDRLKNFDLNEFFFYHMTNQCYKKYVLPEKASKNINVDKVIDYSEATDNERNVIEILNDDEDYDAGDREKVAQEFHDPETQNKDGENIAAHSDKFGDECPDQETLDDDDHSNSDMSFKLSSTEVKMFAIYEEITALMPRLEDGEVFYLSEIRDNIIRRTDMPVRNRDIQTYIVQNQSEELKFAEPKQKT